MTEKIVAWVTARAWMVAAACADPGAAKELSLTATGYQVDERAPTRPVAYTQ